MEKEAKSKNKKKSTAKNKPKTTKTKAKSKTSTIVKTKNIKNKNQKKPSNTISKPLKMETTKGEKKELTKEKEGKFFGKKFFLIITIIAIICIIAFIWFTLTPDVIRAQLVIESGTVQVKHEGESWISAENGMLLHQSDSVKTASDASASIILFESSIIRLDSNTEVMLKEIIQEAGKTSVTIQQDAGRTWNTVLKVSGIDDYEVQTPTTVASVRGTTFDVYIQVGDVTDVGVGSGIVVISKIVNGTVVDTIEAKFNEAVTILPENIDQILEIRAFLKDDWVLNNQQKDDEFVGNVKEEFYKRIDPYIPELKKRFGVTDDELEVIIDGYINGNFDLPPETPDWIKDIMELS